VQTTNILNGSCGKSYILNLKNLSTGCKKDTSLIIPSFTAIKALFSPNPNLNCIPFENSTVTFLDLSNGALSGNWDINGKSVPYVPGQAISHLFDSPGTYNVTLNAVNEGNCPSSFSLPICILESEDIFIPDIFSPNKDGNNEIFYVRSNGIKEMRFVIYDRWGNKIFESNDVNKGWDGTFNGKNSEAGVYAYFLDVILYTDKKLVKKGDVTLIR
jgi:gliding motility-associated-like protein